MGNGNPCCKTGAKLIALPLHFGSPTWALSRSEATELALLTPTLLQRAKTICTTYDCAIVLPSVDDNDGNLVPVAYLVSDKGVEGRQIQVHVGSHERQWSIPNSCFEVFNTKFGRIGLIVGYDGCFPESARVLTLLGAEIIVWSSAWEHRYQRELLAVQKAEDNRVYLVCANRTDSPYPGGSFVIPPNGFPHWDVNMVAPAVLRWGAVQPSYASRAFTLQKQMIPKVDMVRNRLTSTYQPLVQANPDA